jgi:hypothetical protein
MEAGCVCATSTGIRRPKRRRTPERWVVRSDGRNVLEGAAVGMAITGGGVGSVTGGGAAGFVATGVGAVGLVVTAGGAVGLVVTAGRLVTAGSRGTAAGGAAL